MSKVAFGLITLLLNGYGVPCFVNGKVEKGIFTILSSVFTLGVVGVINLVKGIISAIKILNMKDEEYAAADRETLYESIVFFYKG